MTTTQQEANIDVEVHGQRIQVNEHTTIGELDEILFWINGMEQKHKGLLALRQRIYQFMRQHQAFDMYIDECKAELQPVQHRVMRGRKK